MNVCGYIYFADTKTNRQDIISINAFEGSTFSNLSQATPKAKYIIDKKSLNFITKENNFSLLSYSSIQRIAKKALKLDKSNEYPIIAEFTFDASRKIRLKVLNTHKEIFPLPNKSDVYLYDKTYFDMTEMLTSKNCISILSSSILCRYLQYLALCEGYMYDRLFESECGRIFLNATYFAKSHIGCRYLKTYLPTHYNFLKLPFILHGRKMPVINKPFLKNPIINDDKYITPYLKNGINSIEALKESGYTLFDIFTNPDYLVAISENELKENEAYFSNLIWQGVVKDFDSLEFLSYDDLVSLALPDGRDRLYNHFINNRKFYNYHKNKNIVAIHSKGTLVLNE